jgi:hypothetical protein
MKPGDDIDDIVEEFGVERALIETVWRMLTLHKKGKLPPNIPAPPEGTFRPRTKRECALAVAFSSLSLAIEMSPDRNLQ